MSCDAPQKQRNLKQGHIAGFLEGTQRMKPIPSIQQKHGRSSTDNAKRGRIGTITLLRTARCGSGCGRECSSCVFKSVNIKGLYEKENVSTAYISKWIVRVAELVDTEEHNPMLTMRYSKIGHSHSRAWSPKGPSLDAVGTGAASSSTSAGGNSLLAEGGNVPTWTRRLGIPRVELR